MQKGARYWNYNRFYSNLNWILIKFESPVNSWNTHRLYEIDLNKSNLNQFFWKRLKKIQKIFHFTQKGSKFVKIDQKNDGFWQFSKDIDGLRHFCCHFQSFKLTSLVWFQFRILNPKARFDSGAQIKQP